ncbi:MAG: RNA polymerase sigma factor, partial [Chitinophagaceae bacterium]|nr:RNA polymerase sigma factor [Anaerolineae bacterium]
MPGGDFFEAEPDDSHFNDAFFDTMEEEDFFDDDALMEDMESEMEEEEEDAYADKNYELASNDTVGLYLKEMARVPLLNVDEEINLAVRLETGLNAEKKLLKTPE